MEIQQSSYLPADMTPPPVAIAPCEYNELLILIHTRMMQTSNELQTFLERCFGNAEFLDESGRC